jgi:hypothetical protein
MDDGTLLFLSVGMLAQRRFCQWGWWHSVVSVSKDGGTVPFLSVGMMAQCSLSVSVDSDTMSFLSVWMVA